MTRSLASWTSRCAALALLTGSLLCGCAMVTVSSQGPEQYIAMRRGDILSTGRLSAATRDTLHIEALDGNTCQREPLACINTISTVGGINTDRRLSSLAELSLQMAITNTRPTPAIGATRNSICGSGPRDSRMHFCSSVNALLANVHSKIVRPRSVTTTTTRCRNLPTRCFCVARSLPMPATACRARSTSQAGPFIPT
ncbi:hypothetical protein [Paraburkholderia sp. 32]|uniref:hypothetical protein n=1 Tax=Paraburkholderia sp. 32 TaxID=2991057 RepID=UPI003D1B695C